MSLENSSIEEINAELERRKIAGQAEIRRQLEEARKLVRELEAKLGESKAVRVARPRTSIKDKTGAVLAALAGRDFTTANELATLVGFDGAILHGALLTLVSEGKLVREGKARGTKYRLA